jgi:NAD(P)-dependent dehydrogenase (short-subunit alcohol dehydrogenase family)
MMVSRNRQKGQIALDQVRHRTNRSNVDILYADLSVLSDIRRLAIELLDQLPEIHVLINNAGVFLSERLLSQDGLEMNFAVNCLAPFLLTNLLLDRLLASQPARIVNVTSNSQQNAKLDWNNLQAEKNYSLFGTYGTSKLLETLWSYELARRIRSQGVTVNCLHPGSVKSDIGDEMKGGLALLWHAMKPFLITPEQGAKTSVWAATAPELEQVTGQYFVKGESTNFNPLSYDIKNQRRVWDLCVLLSGLGSHSDKK